MVSFTPLPALLGGILIGVASAGLLLANGRMAGVSGILGGLLAPRGGDVAWRASFVAGMVGAGGLVAALLPSGFESTAHVEPLVLAVAGLLVGLGTRIGNGCTSGHGVCGMARFSRRSIVATVVFIASGVGTVALVRLLGGVG